MEGETAIRRRLRREITLESVGWVRIRAGPAEGGVFAGVVAQSWAPAEIEQLNGLMATVAKPTNKAFQLIAQELGTGRRSVEIEWKWGQLHMPPALHPCRDLFSGVHTTLAAHAEAVLWRETIAEAKRLRAEALLVEAEKRKPAYGNFSEESAIGEEQNLRKSAVFAAPDEPQSSEGLSGVGLTAIEIAAMNGHRSSVRVLLAAGATWKSTRAASGDSKTAETAAGKDGTSEAEAEAEADVDVDVDAELEPGHGSESETEPEADAYTGWSVEYVDHAEPVPAVKCQVRTGNSAVLSELRTQAMAAGIPVDRLNGLDQEQILSLLAEIRAVAGPTGADGIWIDNDVSSAVAERISTRSMRASVGDEDLTPALRVELASSRKLSGTGHNISPKSADDLTILLFFYQQCAPNLAMDEKSRAVIQSFKKKAQRAGLPGAWRRLMYSQLKGKYGVCPLDLWQQSRKAVVTAAQQTAAILTNIPVVPIPAEAVNAPDSKTSLLTSFRSLIMKADYEACVAHFHRLTTSLPDWSIDEKLPGCQGRTALHFAASSVGAEKVVALFLEAGAEVDAMSDDGATALQLATSVQTAELLLGQGADPARVGRTGTAVGRRLARVFRSAKATELAKLEGPAPEDAASETAAGEQLTEEDLSLKIEQYSKLSAEDFDFESLSGVGSISTLMTLLKVPNLAAAASLRLQETLATPIIDPAEIEQFEGIAKSTAETMLATFQDASLRISVRAAMIMKAARQPLVRAWFWHLGLVDACRKIVVAEASKDLANETSVATTAESAIDVLAELLRLESAQSKALGGVTDEDWKICELPALEKYLLFILGEDNFDPSAGVVAGLDKIRREKEDLEQQVAARLEAEKDQNDPTGGGRTKLLVSMGYDTFEAAEVVAASRRQIEHRAASLTEKANAIDKHLRPHLLGCGLNPKMADKLVADLCAHPAKHIGWRCSSTGDSPIIGIRYTKLRRGKERGVQEAREKLARAQRHLVRVNADKYAGPSRKQDAKDSVEAAQVGLLTVQSSTELAHTGGTTALERADLDGTDLSAKAFQKLDSASKRDYKPVAAPDLQVAVRYLLAISRPLKLQPDVAGWLWDLESGGFGLTVDERPIQSDVRQFIASWREKHLAEVRNWRKRMAVARFQLQQQHAEVEIANAKKARKRLELARCEDVAKANPPVRAAKPAVETVAWAELPAEAQANNRLLGFSDETWPQTKLEAKLAAQLPMLTGPLVMYTQEIAALQDGVALAQQTERAVSRNVVDSQAYSPEFPWVERAVLCE
eukprot:SAG22_NODE_228_length_14619_cov_4.604132_3_plen_1277_part_00